MTAKPLILTTQYLRMSTDEQTVDYSKEAVAYLESHSQGIRCVTADITDPAFTFNYPVDVVILSHVLEHLEDPLMFLQSMITKFRFRYLIAEVPLEDLLASRLKNLIRDRERNVAGHVQFFTEKKFRWLLTSAAFDLQGSRRYIPIFSPEIIDFVCKKDGMSRIRTLFRKATGLPSPAHFQAALGENLLCSLCGTLHASARGRS